MDLTKIVRRLCLTLQIIAHNAPPTTRTRGERWHTTNTCSSDIYIHLSDGNRTSAYAVQLDSTRHRATKYLLPAFSTALRIRSSGTLNASPRLLRLLLSEEDILVVVASLVLLPTTLLPLCESVRIISNYIIPYAIVFRYWSATKERPDQLNGSVRHHNVS